ncbi:MAG: flagellar biosynthesis protein FlhA [Phycisphaerae bacterium]|nr:flagellar biosynthesis protein FlhA [Phycisphaerae bacterium]
MVITRSKLISAFHSVRGFAIPMAAISLIFVMLVPLPSWMLDLLLAANLAFAAVILLTTIYVKSPLELSVFPSLLLAATLFRLVLNIATTRKILTAGDGGRSTTAALSAAGNVIKAFSEFVSGDSLAVGFIIFLILIIIQFVVITKGATRISEVAARFTLDGMPGKQMAIDADLNAGLINETEARNRRASISQEADFYGAMDGASKFVRGDAIAGIIITIVNILGGLIVGYTSFDWSIGQSMEVFTKLTIGDGLVSQIPAFIISISAGFIVTRSTAKSDLGQEVISQLTSSPKALVMAGIFLGMLTLTEMPKLPLFVLAACCIGIAYTIESSNRKTVTATAQAQKQATAAKPTSERIEDLLPVDRMEMEIGYGLIRLVDTKQGGDLLNRISMIRRQIALELGIIVPSIRIRDNVRLGPNDYSLKIKGVQVASGNAYPDQLLAMDSGATTGKINGIDTTEPAFGLPAVWIATARKDQAEMMNYTVVDCSSVLATHITEVIKTHASELLTRQDLDVLLDSVKERSSAIVEEVLDGPLKAVGIHKILQALLEERVAIRDMETILETLSEWGSRTTDAEVLTEYVRNALARNICFQYREHDGTLRCVTLDPTLEDLINRHIERTDRGSFLTLPPATANQIAQAAVKQLERLIMTGAAPVMLTSPQIRSALRKLMAAHLPNIAVLAYNEIVKGINIESVGMVVIE